MSSCGTVDSDRLFDVLTLPQSDSPVCCETESCRAPCRVNPPPPGDTPAAAPSSTPDTTATADSETTRALSLDPTTQPNASSSTNTAALNPLDAGSPSPLVRDASTPPISPSDATAETECLPGAFQPAEQLTGFGLELNHWGPSWSEDRLRLYFAANTDGVNESLYVASRPDLGTQFSPAAPLSELNTNSAEGTPYIGRDGLRIYFYSNRDGGTGDRDLWLAERDSAVGLFNAPRPLGPLNSPQVDHLPWLSADELSIVFSSNRQGDQTRLWRAERPSLDSEFSQPEVFGSAFDAEVNGRISLSTDERTLVLSSARPGGGGESDLWLAERPNRQTPFSSPTNLQSVNSSQTELDPALSADGLELVFASSRGGRFELWRSVRQVCP